MCSPPDKMSGMADRLESRAWHVTAGGIRGTRNSDTKVGQGLTCPGPTFIQASASVQRPNAPGRNRTCDLALRRRTLYPLSYRREEASLATGLQRLETATARPTCRRRRG